LFVLQTTAQFGGDLLRDLGICIDAYVGHPVSNTQNHELIMVFVSKIAVLPLKKQFNAQF
jgi:hypothetical protein